MAAQVETILRYDGPALADHEMDVEALAPALLSLASLIQVANTAINGSDATPIRVVVDANVEQKCFQVRLKLIHTLLEQAKGFFDGEDVATLKTIAEWIGIVSGTVAGGGWSLLRVLKLLSKQEPTQSVTTGDGSIVYNIIGNPVFNGVPPEIVKLLQNPVVIDKAKGFLEPIRQEGYESVAFYDPRGAQTFYVDKTEAKAILALPSPAAADHETEADEGNATDAVGPAWVATSQFKGQGQWALMWNGARILAKMPEEFVTRFQENDIVVVPNAKLTVKMKIVPKVDAHGNATGPASFTVLEVTNIELPPKAAKQLGMFDEPA